VELNPDTIDLLRSLVAIDSVSRNGNARIIASIEEILRPLGVALERHAYVDAGVEKTNLIARFGDVQSVGRDGGLALVGHTDTVPFDENWSEALQLTERSGRLYGRGACDTKAFIACALSVARRVDPAKLHEPLWLIFTADEEVGCLGAKKLAERGTPRPALAIVGEPTSLTPIRGNKGYCLGEVVVRGQEGHSAYPGRGVSAISGAARMLGELEKLEARLRQSSDPEFSPPFTTLNVGVIQGGKAKNIIAGECTFTLEWRPTPGEPHSLVLSEVQEIASRLQREHPRLTFEVRLVRFDEGSMTPKDSELVRFLEAQSGRAAATVAFGTEAPQMAALGASPVVFGPGDIRTAHQTGEFVPIDEIVRCEQILAAAVQRFCTRTTLEA
jgi:acetylornithine deacetylase